MSLTDKLLQIIGERESGIMLSELYGMFDTTELLDELIKLEEAGRVKMINKNRVLLTK